MRVALLASLPLYVLACGGKVDSATDASPGDAERGAPDTTVSTPTDATSTPPPAVDAGDPPGTTCSACATSHCAPELVACASEAACQMGLDCFNGCSDIDCKNKCLSDSKNPDGTAFNDKLASVVTCALEYCKAPCAL